MTSEAPFSRRECLQVAVKTRGKVLRATRVQYGREAKLCGQPWRGTSRNLCGWGSLGQRGWGSGGCMCRAGPGHAGEGAGACAPPANDSPSMMALFLKASPYGEFCHECASSRGELRAQAASQSSVRAGAFEERAGIALGLRALGP